MKIIVSHPTGNANVRAALQGFIKQNLLFEFHVSLAVFEKTLLHSIGSVKPFTEIQRRCFDNEVKFFTKQSPFFEVGRLLSAKAGFSKLIEKEKGIFSLEQAAQHLDKKASFRIKHAMQQGVSALYGYEDFTLHSFREAKRIGLQCFYDLPIGYWRAAHRIYETEKKQWPEWSSTLTGLKDSKAKLERKDEELRLADKIFVASSFTAKTLKEFPATLAPVEVIPYGFPPVYKNREYSNLSHRRLKILFVGSLSQRKGIANLFKAAEKLGNHIQLTVVGKKVSDECTPLNATLKKHNWIPSLPHHKILELMRQHDVLVFPSLFEGFGLVITEAMSQGTPVITTENTIGPDIIKHGKNGWLIKAGSTESLQTAIEDLLYQPGKIAEVGKEALKTAASRPWEVYGAELAKAVKQALSATSKTKESSFQV